MAPGAKRRRGDRTYSQDSNEGGRPPHRPQEMNTPGQNKQYNNQQQRGGRRGSRGGRGGGSQTPRSPVITNSAPPTSTNTSPTAMSPPPNPPSKPAPSFQPPQASITTSQPTTITIGLPDPNGIPFPFEYVTKDRLSIWGGDGRTAVITTTKQALSDDDYLVSGGVFQELIRAGLDGKLDPSEAGRTVKDILAASPTMPSGDSASFFLDTLTVITEYVEPVPPQLRPLLIATEIDPMKMRVELEIPLLTSLGLVRTSFRKVTIRKATNELYRQCGFNLLREESEGYSKLMTEYFQTVNEQAPTGMFVVETFEKVKALIGTFDLDVGRVLDVTLDVFASLLVKHFRFFIKFLRCSYWWPAESRYPGVKRQDDGFTSLPKWAEPGYELWYSTEEDKVEMSGLREIRDQKFWKRVEEVGVGVNAFFELGGRRIVKDVAITKITNGDTENTEPEQTEIEWRRITNTLPPPGNRIAAQLLGFKLRFYASDARDVSDVLPDNLIYLAGLLIKIGFISILDLYPHLYPPDEAMPALKEKLMKEKAERDKKNRPGGGSLNALAMAGALADDTLPPSMNRLRAGEARASSAKPNPAPDAAGTPGAKEDDEKDKLPEPADQKYKLLLTLLLMGAIPETLFILGRFPWLLDVYPDLPEHVHRLLHHCLSKVYEPLRPLSKDDVLRTPKKVAAEFGGLVKGQLALNDPPARKLLRWAQLDRMDAGDNSTDYKYYWDEWADNVPICQSTDDVFSLCGTLLNLSGIKIGRDPKLMTKLARIGKHSLNEDKSEANINRWKDLCKRLLAPALSLASGNPGVVNEMFELLQKFPTVTRFNIYAEWFTGPTSRLPDISVAFDQSRAETKDVLKRISKENVKQMARALAKVANGSPGIVFMVTLNQIESYSNLIQVVIECAKYFASLGYDVLNWSLLNSLGGRGRDRMQADGMLTSPWLRALSNFAGGAFKRYSVLSPAPILQYINHQLRNGVSTDLEILEQMLEVMTGVRSNIEFNEYQTGCMSGPPSLQSIMLSQVLDERNSLSVKLSTQRLITALVEPGLVASLLISIAQERQVYIFRDENADVPLKVVANNLDKLHHVFIQYLDVLRHTLTVEKFDALIPDVISLIKEYGLDPAVAFAISRKSITASIDYQDAQAREAKKQEAKTKEETDVKEKIQDVEMTEGEDKPSASTKEEGIPTDDTEMKDPSPSDAMQPSPEVSIPDQTSPVISDLAARIKPALPENFESSLSLQFFVRFWQLSLPDINDPYEQSGKEYERIKAQIVILKYDRSDVARGAEYRRSQKIRELENLQITLAAEISAASDKYTITKAKLGAECKQWFVNQTNRRDLHDALLQDCFLPRILLSTYDALYVFKMIFLLHSSGATNFHTWLMIDLFFREKFLAPLIFQFTSREAANFGRFLSYTLEELGKWHKNQDNFLKNVHGAKKDLPGFTMNVAKMKFFTYDDYRQSLFKWHNILQKALVTCVKGGEYMHIRNAIIILRSVHEHFPVVDFMGKMLQDAVKDIAQKDSRQDLKLMAQSLLGLLAKKQKSWMMPQAFRPGSTQTQSGTSTPTTPHAANAGNNSGLNAAASDFKPTNRPIKPGGKQSGTEVEDGEIDDARLAAAQAQQKASAATGTDAKSTPADYASSHDQKQDLGKSQAGTDPDASRLPEDVPNNNQTNTASTSSTIPQRSDNIRPTPNQSASSRVQHALPNRPEPFLRGRAPERLNDRAPDYLGYGPPPTPGDARRPPQATEYGRLERPGENYAYRDPRERSPGRHVRGRSPERDRRDPAWAGNRDAREHPEDRRARNLPRDPRTEGNRPSYPESPRDGRDRFGPDARPSPSATDSRARLHGPPSGPSPASGYHGPREPLGYPERGPSGPPRPERQLPNPPPQHERNGQQIDRSGINPERAHLIESDIRDGAQDNFRDRRDRGSRPHSPTRRPLPPAPAYPPRIDGPRADYRDDRASLPDRPPGSNYAQPPPDRRDDASGVPPTGPRGDRGPRNDNAEGPSHGRMRELFQPPNGTRAPVDLDHGRLNRDFAPPPPRPHQDPSYGRLNASTDIPSGPRGRNGGGRGGRNFAGTQGGSGQPPASPASDRAPQAPFNDRRDQRGPAQQADAATAHSSAPTTPATEQPPSADLSGIHPSRLNQLKPSIQTDLPSPAFAPSGPRGSNRTAQPQSAGAPSPTTRNPPTGPASATDRDRNSRPDRSEDKRFAGVQNILQQANAGGSYERTNNPDCVSSIRGGRTARQSGGNNLPSPVQPSTPTGSRPESTQPPLSSRDLMASKGAPPDTQSQDERSDGRNGRREGRESKSSRHRNRSRSPRTERDGSSRRERDEGRSDHREKRATGSSDRPEGGRESSRRSGREEGRERDKGSDRDREHTRERRDGRGERDREGASHQGHHSGRSNNDSRRSGPPPPPPPPPQSNEPWQGDGRNGDLRIRGEGHRRDGDSGRGGNGGGERGGRKRGRGEEPGSGGHTDKRPRRSQG